MPQIEEVKKVLADVLNVRPHSISPREDFALLGNIPELDSMAVISMITALEERFGIVVDDDEISASTFETLGSLTRFVDRKLTG